MTIKETALKSINKIILQLEKENIQSSSILEKEYNYETAVTISNVKLKIQVYFGKKGIKTVIQGDSNSNEYKRIQNIIFDQTSLGFIQIKINEPEEYIGSDECGKGDFFGPLITAAVYVNKEIQQQLKDAGVRDSKDLKEPQISLLAKKIKSLVGDKYEVIKINPAKYNQLYDKFKNLNKLLNWAHSKAVDSLLSKTNCSTVITDKFSNRDLTITNNSNHSDVNFIQETRAEKYTAVAAASILARNEFNNWFDQQKKIGFDFPKGASEAVTEAASKLLKKIPDNDISNFVKIHFKTFNKIFN